MWIIKLNFFLLSGEVNVLPKYIKTKHFGIPFLLFWFISNTNPISWINHSLSSSMISNAISSRLKWWLDFIRFCYEHRFRFKKLIIFLYTPNWIKAFWWLATILCKLRTEKNRAVFTTRDIRFSIFCLKLNTYLDSNYISFILLTFVFNLKIEEKKYFVFTTLILGIFIQLRDEFHCTYPLVFFGSFITDVSLVYVTAMH